MEDKQANNKRMEKDARIRESVNMVKTNTLADIAELSKRLDDDLLTAAVVMLSVKLERENMLLDRISREFSSISRNLMKYPGLENTVVKAIKRAVKETAS